MRYETCNVYSLKPAHLTSSTSISIWVKFFDKMSEIANPTAALWFYLASDPNSFFLEYPAIFIPSYTQSKIMISSQRFITITRPDAQCTESGKVNDTRQNVYQCFAACMNAEYSKAGKCQSWYSTVVESASPADYCNPMNAANDSATTTQFSQIGIISEEITSFCSNRCPRKCDKITYHSFLQWQQPLNNYYKNGNSSRNKDTLVALSIEHLAMYEKGTLTFIEVNTYSFTDLINNVGGTLGLFVGATLMTFAQAVLFLMERALEMRNRVMQSE